MVLSEAYVIWERETTAKGIKQGLERERSLIFRQLIRRVGELPVEIRSQVEALSIEQLELLGEALLDFTGLSDLQQWLSNG